MEEFFANFHFLRPWWLLLAVLPLVGYVRFFAGLKNVSAWENVCDKNLLEFLLVKGSSRQRSRAAGILLTGMLTAVVALAGPAWQKKTIPAFAPEKPVMFLLNLSSDMDAADVTPNRLARAKYAVSDLLKALGNAQSGLIVYTDEPFLISPLTEDRRVIDNLLKAISPDIMPENGDRLNRALDYAVDRLQNAGYDKGNIVVLAADVGQDFNYAIMSAAGAYAKGFRVSVVDASAAGAEKLQMIAGKGGGIYVNILSGLNQMSSYLSQNSGQKLKQSENEREIWEDAGYYLLFIPLLCALCFFRRGIWAVVFLLAFSSTAEAGFFLNNNQEGIRAFNSRDYQTAAEKFDDPAWKASSYYRSGNFDEAAKYFAGSEAENLYNQGNALAKSGKIEEAIKNYEKVLELAPDHEDAEFNLEYLKKQQQQQQQQQSGGGQNQDNRQNNQSAGAENNRQNENSAGSSQQPEGGEQASEQNPSRSSAAGGQGEENENKETGQAGRPEQKGDEQSNRQDNERQQAAQPTEQKEQTEQQPETSAAGEGTPEEGGQKFSEAAQAREQQFRDIPEDPGGLLRAFIHKEYMKNRYKDN